MLKCYYIFGGEYLSKPNQNQQQEYRRVRTPKKGEIPGVVEQIMGHGKLKVRCADGNISNPCKTMGFPI